MAQTSKKIVERADGSTIKPQAKRGPSPTSKMAKPRRSRPREVLDRGRWIQEGLAVLATNGVAAVRIEVLAKSLDVTKGSFYWHFKDRQELLDAMLEEWRRSTLTAVVESVWGRPINAHQKLASLWRICLSGRIDNPGGPLEAALRQWALGDPTVAELMAVVDAERIAFLAKVYHELPVLDPQGYARLFYGYVVGRNTVAMRVALPDSRDDLTVMAALLLIDR